MRRRAARGARLLAIVAVLAPAGAVLGAGVDWRGLPPAGTEWVEVRSAPGRFSVRMPERPDQIAHSRFTMAGPVRTVEYSVRRGETELRVEHHDLPRLAEMLISDAALLDRAASDLVADEGGVDPRVVRASVRGHPAREVSFRIGERAGLACEALLVLVGRRVYVLVSLHPQEAADVAASERFLGSFQVWEPAR